MKSALTQWGVMNELLAVAGFLFLFFAGSLVFALILQSACKVKKRPIDIRSGKE